VRASGWKQEGHPENDVAEMILLFVSTQGGIEGDVRMTGHSFYRHREKLSTVFPLYILLILAGLFVFSVLTTRAASPGIGSESLWAQRMANSEILRRGISIAYNQEGKAQWGYETGLFLQSVYGVWEKTGRQVYFDYVKTVMDSFVNPNGSIDSYDPKEYNLDQINSGKMLLALYQRSREKKYKKAATLLMNQLESHPRTREGGFWHKKIYPWQMWLDGIYMEAPFYAEFSKMFNRPNGFDDAANQILIIAEHTWDFKTGLFFHGWDESKQQKWADPAKGRSPNFWGRAMGWYAMGIVDVLDFLPDDHPKRKVIVALFQKMIHSLLKYQDPETGLWYQMLDQGKREGNYFEASASSMFVYAMAKGVRKGYLDRDVTPAMEKAYNGIIAHLVKSDQDGTLHLTQICKVAGLGGNPYRDGSFDYYVHEPKVSDDLKGVGPFIMASLEMENLKN
jgi:unsaturated rhamnogalacturonyl hydrolase